jgi:hypothetical protein
MSILPADDICDPATQDTLWSILKKDIDSIDDLAIIGFTQEQPTDQRGNPIIPRAGHVYINPHVVKRTFQFADGTEITIKTISRRYLQGSP